MKEIRQGLRRGASGRMQRYPNAKRMRKISAGVSPAAISALVETNVAPHTETVKSAAKWYLYSETLPRLLLK